MQVVLLTIIVTFLQVKITISGYKTKPGRDFVHATQGTISATEGGTGVLLQGLTLTIVGMLVVFIFLTIMVFVMKIMSAFIPKYFPDLTADRQSKAKQTKKETVINKQKSMGIAVETVSMDKAEIAAVIAAVKSYSHSWKG